MDINKMDISIYDKVQLLLENRAPGEELLLIIKPGEVTHADYFNDYAKIEYSYIDVHKDKPKATTKQIKYIKDLMDKDKKDLFIPCYEIITKDEACSIIKYLLGEDGYNEFHIIKYKENQYSNLNWEE